MSAQYHDPNQRLSTSPPRSDAWMTLFSAWLAITTTSGYAFSVGVYQDIYSREHDTSVISEGWIGATQLFLMLAVSLPAGMQHDSGQFLSLFQVGSIIFVLGLLILMINESAAFYVKFFYMQSILMGVGAGMVYVPFLAVQADLWGHRSTPAMGIASSGLFVGGTVFPIIQEKMLHNGAVFAQSVRVSLLFTFIGLLVAIICYITESDSDASELLQPRPAGEKLTSLKELLTDAPYMCVAIGGLFMNWGIYFAYIYLQPLVLDHGKDQSFAFHIISILSGAAIPGCILSPLAAEKLGTMNLFTASAFCCPVILAWAFFPATSISGVVVFATLFGFFVGAWFSLLPAVFVNMRNSTVRELGTQMGLAFAVGSVAVLTGTPIYSQLLWPTSQWRPIAFSAVAAMTTGAILFLAARQLMVRRMGTQML
ncbi:MFS general substrate transporter [Auriscalpium vulgare]|uniref:MFS general substrate transporter n=1 Tax=Auriscalpium vulgare TaxID=40419 RepID=A0ACB8RQ09_9AGAM|nr:MFS general substrate transporter [Auriscalpium vulgare]